MGKIGTIRKENIIIKEDKKGNNFILYKIDSEGFHRTLFLNEREMKSLIGLLNYVSKYLEDSK